MAYIRSDVKNINENSVSLSVRPRGTKPGDKEGAEQQEIDADILILATGFGRPSIDFLPKDLFPEDYARPNLYLQNFATEDWSVLMTNSAYTNAIGTVCVFTACFELTFSDFVWVQWTFPYWHMCVESN